MNKAETTDLADAKVKVNTKKKPKRTKVAHILFKLDELSKLENWEVSTRAAERRKAAQLKINMVAFVRRIAYPEYECDDTIQLLNDIRGLVLIEDCPFEGGSVVITVTGHLMLQRPAPTKASRPPGGNDEIIELPYPEMIWPLDPTLKYK